MEDSSLPFTWSPVRREPGPRDVAVPPAVNGGHRSHPALSPVMSAAGTTAAWQHLGDPQRHAARRGQGLHVPGRPHAPCRSTTYRSPSLSCWSSCPRTGRRRSGCRPGSGEDRLLPAGQGACPVPGADLLAVICQQPGHEQHQWQRDVKDDTIGQHAEPPGRYGSCGETSCTGGSAPSQGSPVMSAHCPYQPGWALSRECRTYPC
jgi:hypothetical protein